MAVVRRKGSKGDGQLLCKRAMRKIHSGHCCGDKHNARTCKRTRSELSATFVVPPKRNMAPTAL